MNAITEENAPEKGTKMYIQPYICFHLEIYNPLRISNKILSSQLTFSSVYLDGAVRNMYTVMGTVDKYPRYGCNALFDAF